MCISIDLLDGGHEGNLRKPARPRRPKKVEKSWMLRSTSGYDIAQEATSKLLLWEILKLAMTDILVTIFCVVILS